MPTKRNRKGTNILDKINRVKAQQYVGRSVVLHKYGTSTSNGSGVIAGVFETNDITNTDDYSDFTDHYDEFRVLGGTHTFTSSLGPGHTNACALFAMAYDHDDSTAPSSVAELSKFSTFKCYNIGRTPKFTYSFHTPPDMLLWQDCASPSALTGGVKVYCSGLANSTTYANSELQLLVEFRGRR